MTQITTKSAAYVAARGKLGDHRKVFDSVAEALAALKSIFALEAFPSDFPVVAAAIGQVDVTGEDTIPPLADWPEAYQAEGVRVCVTFIGVRGIKDSDGKETNGARGFAIYPLHSIEAIQSESSGPAWLWKVVEKESSHVALRGLRNVAPALGTDALAQAAKAMPTSAAEYVEESTRESTDTGAFDSLWKNFRTMLSQDASTAALVPSLPVKGEVIKAIRSKAYAVDQYNELEEIGAFVFIASTMADIVDHMRKTAVEAGEDYEIDSADIRAWLAGRDAFVFPTQRKPEVDLKTAINFASFMQAKPAATEEAKSE